MDRTSIFVPGLVILLIVSIFIAGCSDSVTPDTVTQPVTTTTAGPVYSDGDIVRNPASPASNAWYVMGYDAASDSYERALIYQNGDGTWGYRSDNRTDKAKRTLMEKVYTEIITNRPLSAVPVKTPTPSATEATARVTVSSAVTTTTTSSKAPKISRIIPDKGDAGTTVQVTDLVGDNFHNGANVTLSRAGSNEIKATGVRAVTPKSITCTFAIPADAPAGSWDVVVTNPDGQSDRYTNIFSVHRTANALTTTLATSAGTVPIVFLSQDFLHASGNDFIITGSQFQKGATIKLQKSGSPDITITAREAIWQSETSLRCIVDIPMGTSGLWDLVITNPDKTYGTKFNAITIT
jgi:hypothetical protein